MTERKTRTTARGPSARAQRKTVASLSDRILASRRTLQPKDTNGMGYIFGGVLLAEMDLAGAYVARRSCKNHFIRLMVTRVMNQAEFKQPVLVNDTITCYGTITKIGNTSVTVHIEVEADREGAIIPVTSCDAVYVALDNNKKPATVGCATTVRRQRRNLHAAQKREQPVPRSKSMHDDCNWKGKD